ncbi:hypothetical protein AC578_3389 [Pseudocercospora eumusae]|uniref:Glycosyl transferase family 3 domain-containing protein n=1 Tax=Pseudocercospora eumusae TaxID=321146 RepID=A0A139H637_9PEZI|nr:hypothetical protein AC578_3389 [Pseudocercospora eumusae]
MMGSHGNTGYVSISSLLKKLATLESARKVSAEEIAAAVSLIFTDSLSPVQFGVLLWALHTTNLDHQAEVLAACAASMREAAAQVDESALQSVWMKRRKPEGTYDGGFCDIVGTGGDGHNTFNVSTTSSIIASAILLMAKHGNNSSTSLSGSADLLQHAPKPPIIAATTARNLPKIYERTNYAFLYAREWHPGMKHAAATRREVPVRTVFNLLGPLANPVHDSGLVECRILGVARKDIGQNFADALRLSGSRKALIVCGDENLDEISCAGITHCWYIHEPQTPPTNGEGKPPVEITRFTISPEDFGLPRHSLDSVHGGKGPDENAEILMQILKNERPDDDPVLHFVLLNTAALITLSGVCDADESHMGEGDDGQVIKERGAGGLRWKEGLRRARWCIKSGEALRQWEGFVDVTNSVST